uniref:VQ domain-containing protein n=1 Tax=Cannabis sativa TaxID=3483 RepID=A0A803QNZ9_CANSA
MEEINNLRSPSLAIHKDSKTISKVSSSTIINTTKPKIRIIHIFAPEIIKTDVANFRELVQRLTGKPTEKDQCCKKESITKSHDENAISSSNCTTTGFLEGFLGFEELTGDEFHNLLPNLDNSHVMQFGFGGPQLV